MQNRHRHKELQRPTPWPEIDALEKGYEDQLKADWQELQNRVATILKTPELAKAPEDTITFSVEQRALILAALKDFIGTYTFDDEDSPVRWYYGQAFSAGLIRAAQIVGQDRPVLDLIKGKELFEELGRSGFEMVKDNATKAITQKILPEIEAQVIAGSNPLTVASRLQKIFGDQNSNWERLARSEMSMAGERAKLAEWAEWDVKMVEFTPAPDACPICMALAGDYPIADAPIPVRDTHPHCRCSSRPAASEV